MRKLLFPLVLASLFGLQAFDYGREDKIRPVPVSLGEVVYAVPLQKEVPTEQLQKDWHYEYINPFANDSLFTPLFQLVRDKQIDVRVPVYPFTEKMNRDSALNALSIPYTAFVENFETFNIDTVHGIDFKRPEHVVAVVFHEEWFYDAVSLALEKRVKGMIPIIDYGLYSDDESYSQRIKPAFYIPFAEGDIKSPDFALENITYTFRPDSVRLMDFPLENKLILRQSYKYPETASLNQKLISSLKEQSKVNTNMIYSGNYPHAIVTEKKKRTALLTQIDSADQIRFRESWSCDLKNFVFSKTVHGVFLSKDMGTYENEYSQVFSKGSSVLAYIPTNREQVSFLPAGKVHVENYYSNASAVPSPDANYPMFSVKDSAAIIELAVSIGERARAGAMPVYNSFQQWEFNDPLDSRRLKLTAAELYDMYVDTQYVYVENPQDGEFNEQAVVFDMGHGSYSGLGFFESWSYEPATGKLDKFVKSLGLYVFNDLGWDDHVPAKSWLFYDNPDAPIDSVFQSKFLVVRNAETPCLINYCEHIVEENDVSVPVAQYGLTYDENIQNELRFQMVQQVLDLVQAGKLTAWTADANPKPFTVPQFRAMIDTTAKQGSFHPNRGCEYYLFNEIRFVEDWYYNPQTGQFYKHVNAITFAHKYYDFNDHLLYGDRRPVQPGLFTIKVNGTK
jgi:hypothetical protein